MNYRWSFLYVEIILPGVTKQRDQVSKRRSCIRRRGREYLNIYGIKRNKEYFFFINIQIQYLLVLSS